LKNREWLKENHEIQLKLLREWRTENKGHVKTYNAINRDKIKKDQAIRHKKRMENLTDLYVSIQLRALGIPITTETIKLKRQQIIMKRTLKEFKQWREEYESNHTDVSGKQLKNEVNHEGRLQAG
jgi:hypothetical protein